MSDFYNTLTKKQRLYFDHYKSNDPFAGSPEFATELNAMLKNGELREGWQEACDTLDEITELNTTKKDLTLYRATSVGFIEAFIIGKEFISPCYISTAEDLDSVRTHYRGVPDTEIPVLLKILCPAGSSAAPLENEKTSGTEKEILIGRNQKFIITSDKTHTDPAFIKHIMDPDLAIGFDQIRVMGLTLSN